MQANMTRPKFLALVAGALSAAAGCGYVHSGTKDHYDMWRAPTAAHAQVLNPEAGKNRKVVAGMDGPAAEQVNKSYVKAFDREPPKKAIEGFAGLSGVSAN